MADTLEIRIELLQLVTGHESLRQQVGKPCVLVPSEVYLSHGAERITDEDYITIGKIGCEPYLKVTGSLWEKHSGSGSPNIMFKDSLYRLVKLHYEFFLFGATPDVEIERFRKSALYTSHDSGINGIIKSIFEEHTSRFEALMA